MARSSAMQKVTFSLPAQLVQEVREAVAAQYFPSQNVLVREAVEVKLKQTRSEQLRREFQEAARDPLFIRDLEETEIAFKSSDDETARMIPNG